MKQTLLTESPSVPQNSGSPQPTEDDSPYFYGMIEFQEENKQAKLFRAVVITKEGKRFLVTKKPPHQFLGVARTIRFRPTDTTEIYRGVELLTLCH